LTIAESEQIMEWTLTFISLGGYIVGLVLLFKIAPALIKRSFDDPLFIAQAAVAILGAMLGFSAVGVTYTVFSGDIAVRGFDVILLVILVVATMRLSLAAFRPRYGIGIGTNRLSRILAGCFFLSLAIVALYMLVLLFVPQS
jgi:hypothetical protein